ncbi:hypothetical protein HN51_031175 [Arachis hypogaea]
MASGLVLSRPVTFVTGNAEKPDEVRAILGQSIPFQSLKLDCNTSLFPSNSFNLTLSSVCFLFCLSCKESLKISPKRRLVWLLFRLMDLCWLKILAFVSMP